MPTVKTPVVDNPDLSEYAVFSTDGSSDGLLVWGEDPDGWSHICGACDNVLSRGVPANYFLPGVLLKCRCGKYNLA